MFQKQRLSIAMLLVIQPSASQPGQSQVECTIDTELKYYQVGCSTSQIVQLQMNSQVPRTFRSRQIHQVRSDGPMLHFSSMNLQCTASYAPHLICQIQPRIIGHYKNHCRGDKPVSYLTRELASYTREFHHSSVQFISQK